MNIITYIRSLKRGLKMGYQMAYGNMLIGRIKAPRVSIFCSSRALADDPYITFAYQIGAALAREGFGVLTGGGPSMMVAANCGARDAADNKECITMGIGVKGVDEHFHNQCCLVYKVDTFMVRKYLLIHNSKVHIFLPGGIGTMDELFTVLNDFKHELIERMPLILFGKNYWQPLVDAFDQAVSNIYIDPAYRNFFVVVDSIEELMQLVRQRF